MKRLGFVLVGLVACSKASVPDPAVTAKKDVDGGAQPVASASASPVASGAPALESASAVSAFYPIAQGACPAALPVSVGRTAVLAFPRAAWAVDRDGAARALALQPPPHYDRLVGAMVGSDWRLGSVGGADEDHLYYTVGDYSGRGQDHTKLFFRGKELATPTGRTGAGSFGIGQVLQQPDGSIWAYGNHGMYLDIPGDELVPGGGDAPIQAYNRWFAWSKDGASLEVNLPKGDMQDVARLDNGELVAAGLTKQNNPKLLRWSPSRAVNDLTTPDVVKEGDLPEVRVGTTRAVMRLEGKGAFYNYRGEDKLTASALAAKAKGATSWTLRANDDLWVATDDGRLVIETKDGSVTEEQLPEKGTLAREKTAPWLMGSSGAVYARDGAAWRKIALPDGLWSDEQHPPNRLEWVANIGGETWASAVRTDKGFGFGKPSEIRTFYASHARTGAASALRCGSPFETSMLHPLAPRADASCKDLVVVLGRERGKDGAVAIPYAKIAAALKGEATLVSAASAEVILSVFGDGGAYGLHAPSREAAAAIAKKLAKLTAHEPELVCGAPDELRHATLDAKAGAFTAIPDAGAPNAVRDAGAP